MVNYSPDPVHGGDTLVGLTPGNGAGDPGPVSILGNVGNTLLNGPNDMVYDFMAVGAVPPGWLSITWPSSDGTMTVIQ